MREKLKAARRQKGLTQVDVAEYLNMQPTSYQRIEAGTRKGDIELWDALEDLFEIPQRQLRENIAMKYMDEKPAGFGEEPT